MLCLVRACQAELYCKKDDCSQSASRYKERYEAQSVVDESPYMISPGDFYYKFVAQHRPFVMRKAAMNCPAFKVQLNFIIQKSFFPLLAAVTRP